jgi:PAS domain S-box-containing protein
VTDCRPRIVLALNAVADAAPVLAGLRQLGFASVCTRGEDTAQSLQAEIAAGLWDIVVIGDTLQSTGNPDSWAFVTASCPDAAVIVVSTDLTREAIVRAMRAGACDYLPATDTAGLVAAIAREAQPAARAAISLWSRVRSGQAATEASQDPRMANHARTQVADIIESFPDAIIGWSTAGSIESWNKGAEQLYGHAAEDAIGQPMALLAPATRQVEFARLHDLVLQGRRAAQLETVHRRRSGREIDVVVTVAPLRDATGGILGTTSITQDITQRKRAETGLRESERKYRLLFEHMTAAFALHEMIFDSTGHPTDYRFLEVNPAFQRLTHLNADLLVGKTVKEVMPATEQDWIDVYGKVVRTGEPISYQNYARELGRYYDAFAFRAAPGQFAVVFTDVTERVRAEEALRESEQLLQTLLDTMPDHIYFKDRQSRVIRANKAQAAYLGYADPAEELGKTDFDFYPRAVAQRFYDLEQETMRTGQSLVGTLEDHAAFANRSCWIQSTKVPIMREGRVVGLVGISRDLTELKHAEEVLAHQAAVADDLARLRSDFVATVSHELRSPLTAIIGYAELLEAQWGRLEDPNRLKMIHRIVGSANRQKRLVEELLLLGRLELGTIVAKIEPVALGSLVSRAAEDIRASYQGQGIDLQGPAQLAVLADPDRALQILLNLLDNAAKYSAEGEPMHVHWMREGAQAVVRVRDFGSGISEEGRQQLFTRFGRVPGSRVRAGHVGTGLGLYLARTFAQAMNGDVELESTSPKGSTFRLTLPVATADTPTTG